YTLSLRVALPIFYLLRNMPRQIFQTFLIVELYLDGNISASQYINDIIIGHPATYNKMSRLYIGCVFLLGGYGVKGFCIPQEGLHLVHYVFNSSIGWNVYVSYIIIECSIARKSG